MHNILLERETCFPCRDYYHPGWKVQRRALTAKSANRDDDDDDDDKLYLTTLTLSAKAGFHNGRVKY